MEVSTGNIQERREDKMTKADIIAELAKNKVVETIISNIGKGTFKDTEDLTNDIYLELLEKPEDTIKGMYEKNQLNFFITRMVKNNLYSVNSRYYYNYGRWNNNRSTFKTEEDKDD